ncbi:MAG: uvrD [Candidatus Saccharibacteria bacterium]|nr:uvrD [Candidatus Saccharibacteria bacterium]
MNFETRYKQLNSAQKSAVDMIDGPVMVIAGPGTGKTELLGMRAANILKQTDTLPENILCLTFTESGSIAMQKRLTDIIGRDAYNVSIFTFHTFGTEIMSRYREYFYQGATFSSADNLARHRIVTEILDSLDYDNPLSSKMNGKYTAVDDIITAISDLKRAGLTNTEFDALLDATQATVEIAGKLLTEVFAQRISTATRDALADVLTTIESIDETIPLENIISFKTVLATSIQHAVDAATSHPKTTPPLTAWKKEWMTSDIHKNQILKVQKSLPKLRALSYAYGLYLQIMEKAELIDFDDMIMQVVHAMEVHDDLRYDLQEKYQYIMVDEFQDTNMAQMRILHNLTNNPIVEDKPNILVVGDDDQAIYGFQGAEVGNILNFRHTYHDTTQITLKDNYRSVQPILDGARNVIVQGSERLETFLPELDKSLVSHNTKSDVIGTITNLATPHDERSDVARSIRSLIDGGVKPNEIAVIARRHSDLVSLLSYLAEQNIPISYDRRDNVLDDEVIIQLERIGRIVHAISIGEHDEANSLLPELISHPAWAIPAVTVWEISLTAHKNNEQWLETMRGHEATKKLFAWIIFAAQQSQHLPLERMVDILIGNTSFDDVYTSPLKAYFFSNANRENDTSNYTAHLENLSTIRMRLREYIATMAEPLLADFLDFITANRDNNAQITSYRHIGEDTATVRLLSAHGSKGLEFDHVFIINATDSMWGEKASGKSPAIAFPPHLRLRQNSNSYDERLRLFYVAMTRARQGLHISYANENDSTKEVLRAGFLIDSPLSYREEQAHTDSATQLRAAEHLWYAPIINIPPVTMQEYLAPILDNYKLSATHVNSFIDVTAGGPQHFLLSTMLRFPSAPTAAASYGIAIHSTLQRAHDHVRATGSLQPEEDILHEFEKNIDRIALTEDEHRQYLQRGSDALRAFLNEKYNSFSSSQQAELDFKYQDVQIDDIRLTGKLDVAQFDKDTRSATVIDYKTGAALTSWEKGQDFHKIKAHKYRQQLLFYKLLVENSRDWRGYTMNEGILQFVEPDKTGRIIDLRLSDIEPEELERFTKLITVIWRHINELSFPDTSHYDASIKGIQQFEADLLAEY